MDPQADLKSSLGALILLVLSCHGSNGFKYRKNPVLRWATANSTDPDQTAPIYLLEELCAKPSGSDFRTITAVLSGVPIFILYGIHFTLQKSDLSFDSVSE